MEVNYIGYDEIKNTQITLNKIKSGIERDSRCLANDPNDFVSKLNLSQLKDFYSNVLCNLNWDLSKQGIVAFDAYFLNGSNNLVEFSDFEDIFNPMQSTIDLCEYEDSSLDVSSVEDGSLKVTLASKNRQDPDDPPLRRALIVFNELIDCKGDINKIEEFREKRGNEVISQYFEFIKALKDKGLNLKLYDGIKPLGFDVRVIDESFISDVFPVLDEMVNSNN